MGVNHNAYLIYGYKAKTEQLKTFEDIPDQLTDQAYGDYPGAVEVLEHLWNKHRDKNFHHVSTNPMSTGGTRVIGILIQNARNCSTNTVNPDKIQQAKKELDRELKEDIAQIMKTTPKTQAKLHLVSRIG